MCLCTETYVGVSLRAHVCVCLYSCVPSPPWPTLHWGCSTSLFFRALLIKFWFGFVQACVCVRVSWCGFGFLGLSMQSQATFQRFSVLGLTQYSLGYGDTLRVSPLPRMYVCVAYVCVTIYIGLLTACVNDHASMRGVPIHSIGALL